METEITSHHRPIRLCGLGRTLLFLLSIDPTTVYRSEIKHMFTLFTKYSPQNMLLFTISVYRIIEASPGKVCLVDTNIVFSGSDS